MRDLFYLIGFENPPHNKRVSSNELRNVYFFQIRFARAGPITDNLFTQSFNESSTLPNIWAALTSVTENRK